MGGLLIVDDQDVVRKGIIKMIDEFHLGIEPIFEAADGEEALRMTEEHRPDIILVDVMMPVKDGFQFVDELKESGSNSHIVIISAFNKFDFAKKAIALKVDNYILKPVTRKELYQVLIGVLGTIYRDNVNRERLTSQQRRFDFLQLYEHLNAKDVFTNAEALYASTGIAALPFASFRVVAVRPGAGTGAEADSVAIKDYYDRQARRKGIPFISFQPSEQLLIYVVSVNGADPAGADPFGGLLPSPALGACLGASSMGEGRHSLPELFRQARAALKECEFRGQPVCRYDEIRHDGTMLIGIKRHQQAVEAIRSMKDRELSALLEELFFQLSKSDSGFGEVKSALVSFVYFIHLNLNETFPELKLTDEFKSASAEAEDFFGLKAAVKREIDRMHTFVGDRLAAHVLSPVIRSVLLYIARHYGSDLSLAVIANEHNVNYNYLSTLFTKTVGVSFTDYLMNHRLEKARELLQSGRFKVHEAAELVGFRDAKYFGKVYRRVYDSTPAKTIPKPAPERV